MSGGRSSLPRRDPGASASRREDHPATDTDDIRARAADTDTDTDRMVDHEDTSERDAPSGHWTFLTNHGHVLLAVHRNPDLRQRDISRMVGITEGAVQRILAELEHDGYLHRERVGRRNHYNVVGHSPLRHPLESNHTIDELLDLLRD